MRKKTATMEQQDRLQGSLKPTQFGGMSSGLLIGIVGYLITTPFAEVVNPIKESTIFRVGALGLLTLYWVAVVNRRLCEPTPDEAAQR